MTAISPSRAGSASAGASDAPLEQVLEPDGGRALQRADLADREQHAGHERLARVESWRIERVWPSPPKRTSWWATRPGRRTEWIGSCTLPPASPIRSAVRLAVPEGASSFSSWCSSMISHSGMCAAICLRDLHHQHGADREVGRDEEVGVAHALELREVGAGRAHHAVHAGLEARARVGERGVGTSRSRRPRRRRRARPEARFRAGGRRARPAPCRRRPRPRRRPSLPSAPRRRRPQR